jgi:S1-C subfamily serine protease
VIDVERRLIVTNAHVVTDAKTLQARKEGDFDKLEATILAVSHQSDLALVTVSDGSFWTGAVALEIGETPRVQAHVDVLGYPMGGDGISITSGVVSRVDWGEYTQGQESNLIVTVDAAINPGNSGGPAVSSGKVVGVAFQGVDGASNIGYIIPATILKLFLQDFQANGSALKGFAQLPIAIQTMENPAMRSWLGMPAGMSGVLVRTVPALCGMRGVVREKDVITKVDGHPVSNDGRAQYGKGSPMDFRVYVSTKLAGNPLALSLFREGAIVELTVPAERQLDLFPRTWYKDVRFFACAPLAPLTRTQITCHA